MIHACVVMLACAFVQDEDRLKVLEEQVRKQQEEIDKLKQAKEPAKDPKDAPKKQDADVKVTLTDGLRAKSADGSAEFHVGGRVLADFRWIADRPDTSRTSPDTFTLRSARIQMDGQVFTDFRFMAQAEMASSSTGSAVTAQNAWIEWKRLKELRVMMGQFRAPISQERLDSLHFEEFIERTPLSRFTPGYEIGIQLQGTLGEGLFSYQAAVMNGRGHLDNAGRSRSDDNDEKELSVRLTSSPWGADKESPFKGLRFGLYGSITDVDSVAAATNFDISTPELGVTFLDVTAGTMDGRRTRLGAELSFAWRSFGFRAEYLMREDEMFAGAIDEDVPTRAWYVQLSWIVTGEEKTFAARITPAHPLDPSAGSWGAIEVAVRFAHTEVGDEIEDLGTSLAAQSNEVTSITLAVSWWLVKNVRVSLNLVREDYHDDVDFGGGREEDALLGALFRFQIDI